MGRPAELFDEAAELFRREYSCLPAAIAAAPGRANLIGEHTDYNEGHVLPVAIDRYTAAALRCRGDHTLRVRSANLGECCAFDLRKPAAERPAWASYVIGVVSELAREQPAAGGLDILIHGDLPLGSGLSSSAALEVSLATATERLLGLEWDDMTVAAACRRAEHAYAGVHCGPMDQIASRACRAGHAALIDCRALEMSHHPLPAAMSLLSVYTGIPRSLAASEYNERRDSCRRAVDVLRGANPQIRALRDASRREIEEQRPSLGERIHRRARHVVTEQERVFDMVKALSAGDLAAAGHILAEGHRSLAVDYEVSSPQLDDMVDWLCRRPGIVGARLTGAGFGGSILAVGRSGEIDAGELAAEFCGRYRTKTPGEPAVWELRSVDGAAFMPAGFP